MTCQYLCNCHKCSGQKIFCAIQLAHKTHTCGTHTYTSSFLCLHSNAHISLCFMLQLAHKSTVSVCLFQSMRFKCCVCVRMCVRMISLKMISSYCCNHLLRRMWLLEQFEITILFSQIVHLLHLFISLDDLYNRFEFMRVCVCVCVQLIKIIYVN